MLQLEILYIAMSFIVVTILTFFFGFFKVYEDRNELYDENHELIKKLDEKNREISDLRIKVKRQVFDPSVYSVKKIKILCETKGVPWSDPSPKEKEYLEKKILDQVREYIDYGQKVEMSHGLKFEAYGEVKLLVAKS